MEFTWLPDIPQSRRRTRALRACASCQRRKKRCRHLGAEGLNSSQTQPSNTKIVPTPGPPSRQQGSSSAHEPTGSRVAVPSSPGVSCIERFVGDLNPEAVIREKIDAPGGTHLRDRIGLWVNAPVQHRPGANEEDTSDTASVRAEHLSKQSLPETQTASSILYRRYLSALKACDHLPRSTVDHLAGIYFSRVNHILPLVDQDSFVRDRAKGATSVLLERAVCLVAAKDRAAAPHLRLTDDSPPVAARKFCSDLYNGLVSAMDAELEPDRVTRIRILALMSLHSEGYEGGEAASMHLCQAIHQAQTAGLHLERPNRLPGDSLTNLFWCLWTLDKLHASIGGRPILLADRDIGIKRPELTPRHSKSAFDVWFTLSDLLSTVISFYRPSADPTVGWETDYPTFEEIMGDHVREDLDFGTLGVLELYYHAIGILSCRYRLSSHRPDGSKPSSIRQGLAAIRIYSLVATECANNLPPLPIVPYAVTLSMGVSYQQFRTSKIITHSDRAKASLEACCALLGELGVYWYSAEAMARLGRRALRQIGGTAVEDMQHGQGSRLSAIANDGDESVSNNPSTRASQGAPSANIPVSSLSGEDPILPPGDEVPVAVVTEPSAPLPFDAGGSDLHGGDGFANFDTLFGDFLDLSLPTNFWDPIFFQSEPSEDNNNL